MDAPYELRRITSMEWVILDLSLSEHDPRRTVACIYEVDTLEFDVIWLRDLGLAGKYAAPEEVLEAVVRVATKRRRSQRPVPIPHVPPAEAPLAV